MSKQKHNHQNTQKTMSPPMPAPVAQAKPAPAPAPVAQAKPAPAPVNEAKPAPVAQAKPAPAPAPVAQAKPAPAPVAEAKPASKPAASAPSYEEIARRAYELYQRRGAQPGRAGEDWLQAERELSSHASS